MTICQVLTELYRDAVVNENLHNIELIEDAFLSAKKMNRKLVEYKQGYADKILRRECQEQEWIEEIRVSAR